MRLRAIGSILRKEMRETLRDRRTLLMILVIPLVLYPAVLVLLEQLALTGLQQVSAVPARVELRGHALPGLREYLERKSGIVVAASSAGGVEGIRWSDVDAVAVIDTAPSAITGSARVRILFDASIERSIRGEQVLAAALRSWADTLLRRRLAERELPAGFTQPLRIVERSVAPPARHSASIAGRILPLVLVLITLLGAFYPAIDLAAGEKERGTLETLLMTPTPPWVILTGKFLTVAAVGATSAAVNLGSMLITVRAGLFSLPEQLGITAMPLSSVVFAFLTLVPLTVLFAGLFLGIAVRAHSFKEAQNALTPVYILVLIPALLPAIPGIELTAALAATPVAGVTLLLRDLLVGRHAPAMAAIALASTALYAGAALLFAAKSFGAEHVLFGQDDVAERRSFWRSLFPRRGAHRALPSLAQAGAFIVVLGLLQFYVGRPLVRGAAGTGAYAGILLSQWLLLFVPALLFMRLTGARARDVLGLRAPTARQAAGGVLLVLGALPVGLVLAWLQTRFLVIPDGLVETLRSVLIPATTGEALLILLVAVVTPAICEEVVFRGVFLSATRGLHWTAGVLLSALVFGLFHVSFESVIRFLPTAWLGLVLGWTMWWTRSIWLVMLGHALHNAALLLLARAGAGLDAFATGPLPVSLLAFGLAAVLAGGRLIRSDAPPRRVVRAPVMPVPESSGD